jgi:large subunit ribosomal protein L21
VLLYVDGDTIKVGAPTVSGATISATVLGTVKGPKVTVFKYRPKKRYRVKTGHRAKYTKLMIDTIGLE